MLPLTSKMSPLWDIISRYVIGGKEEKGEVITQQIFHKFIYKILLLRDSLW